MNWFINTFLASLEDRYTKKGKLWITEKQVSVCRKYMHLGSLKGQMFIDSKDKRYMIQIAPNGCANFFILNKSTGFIV